VWVNAGSKLGALIRLCGDEAVSNEAKMGSFYTGKSTPPAHRTGHRQQTGRQEADRERRQGMVPTTMKQHQKSIIWRSAYKATLLFLLLMRP
jgi:hypothetical protein